MKSRSTIKRELDELLGILARSDLADGDKMRVRNFAQALRWALHGTRSRGIDWTRPRDMLATRSRRRREYGT